MANRLWGSTARAASRLAVASLLAVVAAVAVTPWAAWQQAVLFGWNVFSFGFLMPSWWIMLRSNSARTASIATREDESREASGLVLLMAAMASLLAVGVGLVKANQVGTTQETLLTVSALLAILGAWAIVNTHFAFHYARLYYDGPDGGIDFNSDDLPDYLDFAYLSFTVGMTYQVSDTDIESRAIRRSVTRHALLSYLFGTGIIATSINIVAGLVR
ncbi:MAG: putative rane protein [Acidimicrobiia bacterium]|nr:putative rane protein [Acidimicrobiia bacterium]